MTDRSHALALAAQWAAATPGLPAEQRYASLLEQDAELAAHDFPPLSDWWREQFARLYLGGRRRLVAQVGRRGGKSTSGCRLAVNEVRHGLYAIPPGDVGVYGIVSVSMGEAEERLRTIAAILDALGIEYDTAGRELRPRIGRPVVFRVYAAQMRTIVGGTWIGALFDELASWRDDKTGANPATEVLRRARPAMKTQHHALELMLSSPFSTIDAHYEAFKEGDTDRQVVGNAPTWVANPTETEASCRLEEPDESTFMREYGAVPMAAGAAVFFDHNAIDAAVRDALDVRLEAGDVLTAGCDAGFRRNSSTLAIVRARGDEQLPIVLREWKPPAGGYLQPSVIIGDTADELRARGLDSVMGDAVYRASYLEYLEPRGIHLVSAPPEPAPAFVSLRAKLHQGGRVLLPRAPQLLRDLKETMSRPTPNGRLSIILPKRPDGSHADVLAALVLACYQRSGYVVPSTETNPLPPLEREMRQDAIEQAKNRGAEWWDDPDADGGLDEWDDAD